MDQDPDRLIQLVRFPIVPKIRFKDSGLSPRRKLIIRHQFTNPDCRQAGWDTKSLQFLYVEYQYFMQPNCRRQDWWPGVFPTVAGRACFIIFFDFCSMLRFQNAEHLKFGESEMLIIIEDKKVFYY